MSRGEAIASPSDPTPDGYRGSLTRNPVEASGGPSEVDAVSCAECGLEFEPAKPAHRFCPECWRKEQPLAAADQREAAIEEAEQRWKDTQKRWGMS